MRRGQELTVSYDQQGSSQSFSGMAFSEESECAAESLKNLFVFKPDGESMPFHVREG
jgi:hypothetical protein